MTHELKCERPYFEMVASGRKTVEIRKDDRRYQIGDELLLNEYVPPHLDVGFDPDKDGHRLGRRTGRSCLVLVTHILRDRQFVPEGYVGMSVRLIGEDDSQRGLYRKFKVLGGPMLLREIPGPYFVLRPEKDVAARAALLTYAAVTHNQALAGDLLRMVADVESHRPGGDTDGPEQPAS